MPVLSSKGFPFKLINDEVLKLSLSALEEHTNTNLKLLPAFSVGSLINKIPGHSTPFNEVFFNKNSSKYYDIDEFLQRNFESNSSLSVFHINVASLTKHHEELRTLLNLIKFKFKVIGISETRLTTKIGETVNIELDSYQFFHTKTLSNAGGTGLYVHNSYMNNVKVRNDLSYQSENGYESTFIEISQARRKNIICGCIYKHPNLPPDQFFEDCLLKILDKITKEDKLITIKGDCILIYSTMIQLSVHPTSTILLPAIIYNRLFYSRVESHFDRKR